MMATAHRAAILGLFAAALAGAPKAAAEGAISPRTATWLSALCTLAPVAGGAALEFDDEDGFDLNDTGGTIVGLGLIVGPSVGHGYARAPGRVLGGLALRAGGLCLYEVADSEDLISNRELSDVLGTLGLAAFLGSVIYDIATADRSADRHNERHGLDPTARLKPRFAMTGAGNGLLARLDF